MNTKAAFTFARREFREIAINARERIAAAEKNGDESESSFWYGAFMGQIDALSSCGVLTIAGRNKLADWIKEVI